MRRLGGALLRRALQAVFVALLVGVLCFVLVRTLPGDMAFRIAASRYGYDLVDARGRGRPGGTGAGPADAGATRRVAAGIVAG